MFIKEILPSISQVDTISLYLVLLNYLFKFFLFDRLDHKVVEAVLYGYVIVLSCVIRCAATIYRLL